MELKTENENVFFVIKNVYYEPGINGVVCDIVFTEKGIYCIHLLTAGVDSDSKFNKDNYPKNNKDQIFERDIQYGTSLNQRINRNSVSKKITQSSIERIIFEKNRITINCKDNLNYRFYRYNLSQAEIKGINSYPNSLSVYDRESDTHGLYLKLPSPIDIIDGLASEDNDFDIKILDSNDCIQNKKYIRSFYLNLMEKDDILKLIDKLSSTSLDFRKLLSQNAYKDLEKWNKRKNNWLLISIFVPVISIIVFLIWPKDEGIFWKILFLINAIIWPIIGISNFKKFRKFAKNSNSIVKLPSIKPKN